MKWHGRGDKPVRIGQAGLGRFGKLHAMTLTSIPGVELTAVCDPSLAEREWAESTLGIATGYADFDSMLAAEELDALYIVTPEEQHAAQVTTAIEQGLPVFLEKPLATTSAEGERILELARSMNVYVQLGFVLRFETRHAHLQSEIAAGRFGEIVTIHAKRNCSKAWFEFYGDRAHSAFETIIHDIDLVVWMLPNRCERVYAVQRHVTGHVYPDATVAVLQFAGGAMVTLETSWLAPARTPANVLTNDWYGTIDAELRVVGTERSARIRGLETGLEIWTDDVSQHPESALWPQVHGQIGGAMRAEDQHFVDCVRRGESSTVASVDDALAGLRIAEAIVQSAESGKEIVLNK